MVSKLPRDRLNHFSELDCSLLFFRVVFSFRIAEIFFRTYYASYLSLVVQFSKTVSPSLSCDSFAILPHFRGLVNPFLKISQKNFGTENPGRGAPRIASVVFIER